MRDPLFRLAVAADLWVRIRPGTDSALVNGMINWILQNGKYDADYLTKYTVAPFLIDPGNQEIFAAGRCLPGI